MTDNTISLFSLSVDPSAHLCFIRSQRHPNQSPSRHRPVLQIIASVRVSQRWHHRGSQDDTCGLTLAEITSLRLTTGQEVSGNVDTVQPQAQASHMMRSCTVGCWHETGTCMHIMHIHRQRRWIIKLLLRCRTTAQKASALTHLPGLKNPPEWICVTSFNLCTEKPHEDSGSKQIIQCQAQPLLLNVRAVSWLCHCFNTVSARRPINAHHPRKKIKRHYCKNNTLEPHTAITEVCAPSPLCSL